MDWCNNIVPSTILIGMSLDHPSSIRYFQAKFAPHFSIQSNFDNNHFTISIIFFDSESPDISLLGSSDGLGGGSNMAVCSLEEVGHRYATDGKIKQVLVVREKHSTDLDVYLDHLRAKLTTTFLDMLDGKQAIHFWLTDYVRNAHPTKDLTDKEPIVLHSGKRIVTSPVVLDKQLDSLIDALRDRHSTFNRNLSGLVLDEII